MNVRPNQRRNIFITGIFISVLSALAMIFIFMLGSDDSLFTKTVILKTKMKNASNLKVGSSVQLKGIRIGTLSKMEFENLNTIGLSLTINANYLPYIKKDCYLAINTQGVLGDKFLEILGGTEESEGARPGDYLTIEEVGSLNKILNKGEDLLAVTATVLSKINLLIGDLPPGAMGDILKDLKAVSTDAKIIISEVKSKNIATMATNMSNAAKQMESTSQSLTEITQRIQKGPGTIHSLIYEKELYDDIAALLDGSKRSKVLKYFIRETIKSSEEKVNTP